VCAWDEVSRVLIDDDDEGGDDLGASRVLFTALDERERETVFSWPFDGRADRFREYGVQPFVGQS